MSRAGSAGAEGRRRDTTLYGRCCCRPANDVRAASVPLIVNPYGGPGVRDGAQSLGRARAFSSTSCWREHGFAVLHIDNRGMGGRGRDFAQAAYHNFGPVQLADQMAVVDQVLAKYPQLDPKRHGLVGLELGRHLHPLRLTHSRSLQGGGRRWLR